MSSFLDRVIFTASSGSTGSFIQGSSVTGYQLMAAAGAVGGTTYRYGAQSTDLTQWEYGSGVWTSTTNTLTRVPLGNNLGSTALVNFTNPPQVMITLLAEDFLGGNNLNFYVATTGSDSNSGTSASSPWLTLQHAMSTIAATVFFQNTTVTVNIGAGTFVGVFDVPVGGTGHLKWVGAGSANTFITPNQTFFDCVNVNAASFNNVDWFMDALTFNSNDVPHHSCCVFLGSDGTFTFGSDVKFEGAGQNGILDAQARCEIYFQPTSYTIDRTGQASMLFEISLSYTAKVIADFVTFVLTTSPNYTEAFILMNGQSWMSMAGPTFTGSVTGIKYLLSEGSIIETDPSVAFPGSLPGQVDMTSSFGGNGGLDTLMMHASLGGL